MSAAAVPDPAQPQATQDREADAAAASAAEFERERIRWQTYRSTQWDLGDRMGTGTLRERGARLLPLLRPSHPSQVDSSRQQRQDRMNNMIYNLRHYLSRPHAMQNDWSWSFGKTLGSGGYGFVTLWERRYEPETADMETVVIKGTTKAEGEDSFILERQFMNCLNGQFHIASLSSHGLQSDAHWLYMNWCEHGDLHNLIAGRKQVERPFHEITLWGFFQCLVDGLAALDHYDEDTSINPDRPWRPMKGSKENEPDRDPGPITHWDIKPLNMFLDWEHGHAEGIDQIPTPKFGDFGIAAWEEENNRHETGEWRRGARWGGTEGHLPPECFSEEWDGFDEDYTMEPREWHRQEIGNYSTPANIWCVGVIMYQLMNLSGPPGLEPEFITQSWYEAEEYEGRSYGGEMEYEMSSHAQNYSERLRELVYSCLMKKISLRPRLHHLGDRVKEGCDIIRQVQEPETMEQILYRLGPEEEEWPWPDPEPLIPELDPEFARQLTSETRFTDKDSGSSDTSDTSNASNFETISIPEAVPGQVLQSAGTKARVRAQIARRAARRRARRDTRRSLREQARRNAEPQDPNVPLQLLRLRLYHFFDHIPTDSGPIPSAETSNIRVRLMDIMNNWTFDELKDRIAGPNNGINTGLGIKREDMKLRRLDLHDVIEYGDDLGGWTLAEAKVPYGALIWVDGFLAQQESDDEEEAPADSPRESSDEQPPTDPSRESSDEEAPADPITQVRLSGSSDDSKERQRSSPATSSSSGG